MTMASPALAVKVQASISPVEMVPVSVEPFIIGPPSSPAEITTGSPVLARVRRYWPVPLSAPLPSPTTTRYVPLVGADAEPTSAADAPKLDCTKVPLGLYNRTQGVNEFVSVILPTLARRASPATALNVHTSRSPVRIVPVCMTPLVIGPPSSPRRNRNRRSCFDQRQSVRSGQIRAASIADRDGKGARSGRCYRHFRRGVSRTRGYLRAGRVEKLDFWSKRCRAFISNPHDDCVTGIRAEGPALGSARDGDRPLGQRAW